MMRERPQARLRFPACESTDVVMAETRKFDGEIPREAFSMKSGGGNSRARRMLVEGAWTYRLPARMGAESLKRNEVLPQAIKQIAWKA
jgi:hypothetical protein